MEINSILKYIRIIEFFKGTKGVYLIIIDIVIIIIILLFIALIMITFNMQKKYFFKPIYFNILKIMIPIILISFFGQIFHILLSIIKCEKGLTFFSLDIKCEEINSYTIQKFLSIFTIIILILMSSIFTSIYYIPIFVKGNNNLKKVNSFPELIFLVNKILIIFLFYFENLLKESNRSMNQCLFIIILVVITGINSYISIIYKNSSNKTLLLINNIMSLELFWGFFSLLIAIIFKYIGFSGVNYLFIIGALLIVIWNIYFANRYQEYYWKNFNTIYINQEKLNYIFHYINIIEKRNKTREDKVSLKLLIEKLELSCTDPKCKIKKYLYLLKKGIDSNIMLYYDCENIFKDAISKDENNIIFLIYYIMFIVIKLNKIKKANILLKKLEELQLISFQDLFNIYRTKKLIEEFSSHHKKDKYNFNYINIINIAQFKKYKKEFKFILYKISSLYYNFWNLLLNSYKYHNENIQKINNTGKEIKKLIKQADDSFNILNNYMNDIRIIKLYTNFIKYILGNKKLYQKYNKIIMNVFINSQKVNREEDYSNYDINYLEESDELSWMLVSAEEKEYGKIINISLSICPIIGYKKPEIVGKHINYLIPNIFHKHHNEMINKLFYDSKYQFYENLSKKLEYKPIIFSKFVYCKTKSKFLIPFPFKSTFIHTEEGLHLFLMNVIKYNCFYHSKNISGDQPWCCVLTDKHFFIQTFTPNAFEYLGLNSKDIDSGLNIINCIQQFGPEFIKDLNIKKNKMDINDEFEFSSETDLETSRSFYNANTKKSEKKLRRELTKKRFSIPQLISWRYSQNVENKNNFIIFPNASKKMDTNNNDIFDKELILQIQESKINNILVGYKFLFKLKNNEENSFNNKNKNLNGSNIIDFDLFEVSNANKINNNNEISTFNSIVTKKSNRKRSLEKYVCPITLLNNEKQNIHGKRRCSQGDIHQNLNINNFSFEFKIDTNFVPKNNFNLNFDINKMTYLFQSKDNTNNSLLDILLEESKEKIAFIQNQLESSKYLKSVDEKEEYLSSSKNYSFSSSSSSSNSSMESSISLSISDNSKESKINPTIESKIKHNKSTILQNKYKGQNIFNENKVRNKLTKANLGGKKNSIKEHNLIRKITSHLKEKNKINLEFKYYEVNIKHIRFLKYDFYKETIIEDNQLGIIGKMTEIIKEIKNNSNKFENKDENYPYINIEEFILNRKKNNRGSIIDKNDKSDKKLNLKFLSDHKEKPEKKKEKENRIEEALNKREKQHSIKNFIIISIICLIGLYAICGINFYFYFIGVKEDKNNIQLICESTDLKFYYNSAVYFIRELTLLNMNNIEQINDGEYTGFPSYNKTYYIEKLNYKVMEIYSIIHNLNEMIISNEFSVSENSSYYLNGKDFIIEKLINDFEISYFRTSLSNYLILLDAYLCNLADFTTKIEQSHKDLFPFIHNTLNNIGNLLDTQIKIYMSELVIRSKKNKLKIFINHCIIFAFLMIILVIISKAYSLVLEIKEKYFFIFYGIKKEIIQVLINDCELFVQKLKEEHKMLGYETEQEEKNEEKEEESNFLNPKPNIFHSIIADINSSEGNILSTDKNRGIKHKINMNKNYNENKDITNYKYNLISFIIGFFLFLIMFFIYLILIIKNYYLFYYSLLDFSTYNYHLQRFHNEIIEIINGYREFLFDQNSVMNGTIINNYINIKINEIYTIKFEDNICFNKYRGKMPDLLNEYNIFKNQTLCSRKSEDYFESENECELHMGGITTYGISTVHTTFIEEIRIYKNIINQLLNNGAIIGNLTLYGSKNWSDDEIINDLENANNSPSFYRLYLFNNNSYHKDINILFINSLYPYIEEDRKINRDSINNKIKNKEIKYIVYFIFIMFVITLLFLIFWLPKIKKMNSIIYETKKTLSIIPIHILASQDNIYNLLNIEINTEYK